MGQRRPKNLGGFIYTPVENHADDMIAGEKVPRSYGSVSYSGLLSYIYADLQKKTFGTPSKGTEATENL